MQLNEFQLTRASLFDFQFFSSRLKIYPCAFTQNPLGSLFRHRVFAWKKTEERILAKLNCAFSGVWTGVRTLFFFFSVTER